MGGREYIPKNKVGPSAHVLKNFNRTTVADLIFIIRHTHDSGEVHACISHLLMRAVVRQ
jgi:hypothetical protein